MEASVFNKQSSTNAVQKYFLIFLISAFINGFANAQQSSSLPDSTQLYENIETYSKRSKFTMFMYRLVFKPVASISKKIVKKTVYKKLIQKPYINFEGKIIRHINIETLDPFGYSSEDTSHIKQNFIFTTGNKLHIKTQRSAIMNLLLIRENEPFNSLLVKESERLVRVQNYVHDVSFYVVSAGKNSDSADIFIRELDTWSIMPAGSISNSAVKVDITDKNFLGSGHEFRSVFSRNLNNDINRLNTNYYLPNIKNTYISALMRFEFDGYRNNYKSITVDRPFFSPLAKWAAGLSIASESKKDSLKYLNSYYVPLNLKYKTQDIWAGNAIPVFKNSMEKEEITNLIFTMRYLRVRYFEKPSELYDPLHNYSDEDFLLAGIGISTRRYLQDKYVFKFGVIEDVPVGLAFGVTGGYQVKNKTRRSYLGMRISFGNYYEWGYLSSNFEYGTFINATQAEQGVLTAGINYFSGLFDIGKWKLRQFVKPEITIGVNRFSYDSLTLKDEYGLDGFNSSGLSGTNRILLTLQTQLYAPWNFIGFRFGPFLTYSMGMLGDASSRFKNSKVYSLLGIGVLIKNENLVFNTFQFSISFYPVIPGYGQNVFKTNSFKTTDLGFRDFEIGKPGIMTFQ